MAITDDIAAEVLSRSARHCCICRNFLPLKIQVHHIIEQSDGGTDGIDNLIPVCIDCHSAIHTKTYMTRNFSPKELKKSRDSVYEMVSSGKLPATKPLTRNEIETISSTLAESLREKDSEQSLSNEAMEILTMAICEQSLIIINTIPNSDQQIIIIGDQYILLREKPEIQYPKPIIELLSNGYIETNGNEANVSAKGLRLVEKIVGTTETFTQKKVKCLDCGVHFIVCSWYRDKHDRLSLHCPECGQNHGNFLVWTQQKFGFIFQDVPGKANLYADPQGASK
ncbi:HNH endonuclease [Clostridium botulinum]|uniref:HNH endonuclease n=1 Tax=Clostridium botulinum TaxID=1491 RepID=UPI001FD63DD8|nr:HNH endonuclease [Clostridium botulinum]MCJ8172540.1 HNH endonuclease [Clostridium botulinum]